APGHRIAPLHRIKLAKITQDHLAFRQGFAPRLNRFAVAPRFNRFAFARFNRFHHRRFAFAAVPFVAGIGLYGGSCWSWQPTPWGWQRVWAWDYDYGYY